MSAVVAGGYCVGCGVCASASKGLVSIRLNGQGKYEADLGERPLPERVEQLLDRVCPFSNASRSEDELSAAPFAAVARKSPLVGWWKECYIGYVASTDFRQRGSSGGFTSWLLCELLRLGHVDGVIHVVATAAERSEVLFSYGFSSTADAVKQGAKSRYYAVEMSGVLELVRSRPGRYVFVGVPCFIKAVRLLAREDPEFAPRVAFTFAILCGQLKSTGYLEFLAWQMGVSARQIEAFDFRHKLAGNPARNYAVAVRHRDATGATTESVKTMTELRGGDWGIGLFKYKACDYCDDIMGETADVAAGDAWVRPYADDPLGHNVIVVRNPVIHGIIEQGRGERALHLKVVSPNLAASTQDGSFRHRRAGLSFRLWRKEQSQEWAPRKRVPVRRWHLTPVYRRIFAVRAELVELSDRGYAAAMAQGDWSAYWPVVEAKVAEHQRLYARRWFGLRRMAGRVLRRLKALR